MYGPAELNGECFPASRCFIESGFFVSMRSVDNVYCIRCLVWPSQAAEWTSRRRDHNWPNAATISMVVSNGCDIVQVAHPWYKENEIVNTHL